MALNQVEWQQEYPMDYYANDSLGPWTVNNELHRPQRVKKVRNTAKTKPSTKTHNIGESAAGVNITNVDKDTSTSCVGGSGDESQNCDRKQMVDKAQSEDCKGSDTVTEGCCGGTTCQTDVCK